MLLAATSLIFLQHQFSSLLRECHKNVARSLSDMDVTIDMFVYMFRGALYWIASFS